MVLSIIIVLFAAICWIVYSLVEGKREGLYYHARLNAGDLQSLNEHPMFTVQRFIVSLFLLGTLGLTYSFLSWCIVPIYFCICILFPYFHDGEYYKERHLLNKAVYPLSFKDFGNGSAKNDFTYNQRLAMLISGIVGVIVFVVIGTLIH